VRQRPGLRGHPYTSIVDPGAGSSILIVVSFATNHLSP